MGYTNETELLKLPQWIATDKPDWLNDVNGAFRNIDEGFADVKSDSSQASSDASAALNTIGNINDQIEPMQKSIASNTQAIKSVNDIIKTNKWVDVPITNINGSATNLFAYKNDFLGMLNIFGRVTVNGGATPNNTIFKLNGLNISAPRILNSIFTQKNDVTTIVPFQIQVGVDGTFRYINTGDQGEYDRLIFNVMLNISSW